MDPAKTELTKVQNKHHFLFYLFKADKAANPMPQTRAESLLNCLKNIFSSSQNENSQMSL